MEPCWTMFVSYLWLTSIETDPRKCLLGIGMHWYGTTLVRFVACMFHLLMRHRTATSRRRQLHGMSAVKPSTSRTRSRFCRAIELDDSSKLPNNRCRTCEAWTQIEIRQEPQRATEGGEPPCHGQEGFRHSGFTLHASMSKEAERTRPLRAARCSQAGTSCPNVPSPAGDAVAFVVVSAG